MAYKCKTCGYRFKSDDSDLCPECFTARNDIGCETFEKHTHSKFSTSSIETDDFITEQLKSENDSAKKFTKENRYSQHNNTQNTATGNNPYRNTIPPTNPAYTRTNYSNNGRSMPYNTYSNNSVNFRSYNPTRHNYNASVIKVRTNKVGCIITIVIILIFFIPIFVTVFNEYMSEFFSDDAGAYAKESVYDYSEYEDFNYSYDYDYYVSEPEYFSTDGKLFSLASPTDAEDEFVEYIKIEEDLDINDESLYDSEWIYKYFEFSVEELNGEDITDQYDISDISVQGIDGEYKTVYSYTQNNEDGSFSENPYKLVYNEYVELYYVNVVFVSKTDGNYKTAGFYFEKDTF